MAIFSKTTLMKKLLFAAALLSLLSPATLLAQKVWKPVSYSITFKIKNAGITVNGKFSELNTELVFNPDDLAASHLKGSVQAGSLTTGINMRDKTIKDEKYLDADKFKLIEISSVKLYTQNAQYAGKFNVTIKGVTKEMEIPFDFIQFGDEADFKGTITLNRRDFNVGGSSSTMSDNLTVTIAVKTRA